MLSEDMTSCFARIVKAIRAWQTGYRKVVGDTCEGGWQPQQAVAATSQTGFEIFLECPLIFKRLVIGMLPSK